MLADMEEQMQSHWKYDKVRRHSHHMLVYEYSHYYEQLRDLTKLQSPPEILNMIFYDSAIARIRTPLTYRKYRYMIINNQNFDRIRYER